MSIIPPQDIFCNSAFSKSWLTVIDLRLRGSINITAKKVYDYALMITTDPQLSEDIVLTCFFVFGTNGKSYGALKISS